MLTIDIIPKYGFLFIKLKGKLDKTTINKFNLEVTNLVLNMQLKNIVLNINDLIYIDNIGIKEINNNLKFCINNKGTSIICGNNNILKKLKKIKHTYYLNDVKKIGDIIWN